MLKVITYLSLVPKVTTVEHIKGPPYSQLLLPGERTAERENNWRRDKRIFRKTENFEVSISFITLFIRTDQTYTELAQVFQFFSDGSIDEI